MGNHGSCSTGQSPPWAVVPVEEEEVNKISTVKHSRISIARNEGDRRCLELPKSSDYSDYDNSVHTITCTI
jgi:hypothetical protein